MYNWTHDNPVRVLFGPGRLNDLHKEALPGGKALIVTSNGASAKKYGYLARDITADPLPLSDEDYLTIFRNAYHQ